MKNIISKIDWSKGRGLIPAIVQDTDSNTVLMLGYMNKEAIKKTFKTKKVWFFSRSKKRLWMKGETSRNVLRFIEAKLDCDRDTLLIKAVPAGPTCHAGNFSCFDKKEEKDIFKELFRIIISRRKNMPKGSYTASLFRTGLMKICAKIKEESGEVIKAAKQESKKRLTEESVDLLYHLFVLLVYKNISLIKLKAEIKRRRKSK